MRLAARQIGAAAEKWEELCDPGRRCTNCENSTHPHPKENRYIRHLMHVEEMRVK